MPGSQIEWRLSGLLEDRLSDMDGMVPHNCNSAKRYAGLLSEILSL